MTFQQRLQHFWTDLSRFPWRDTAHILRKRFREDRIGLTASSLTFTTLIALVPFFTLALAIFTAFPMFSKLQGSVQVWLVQSLIPDNISRQVLGYLTLFSRQASKLGVVGLAVLMVTAIALILTIDRTLNGIWRVKKPRSLTQRILIYWAAMTLGPLLLACSLALTSFVFSNSSELMGVLPAGLGFLLDFLEFILLAGGMAALYHFVPNTYVAWPHAWVGGLWVAAGIELAKKGLGFYLAKVPAYSLIYGAFATLPILLVWIYLAWTIVLLGAVIAAYLPSLMAGTLRRDHVQGWRFQLALEVLQMLDAAKSETDRGLTLSHMCLALRVSSQHLEPVMQTLQELDWAGRLEEAADHDGQSRYILLANLDQTLLEPLIQRLLLSPEPITANLWKIGPWPTTSLREVLQKS